MVAFGSPAASRQGRLKTTPAQTGQRPHVDGVHRRQALDYHVLEACARHSMKVWRWWLIRSSSFTARLKSYYDAEHFFDWHKRNPDSRCASSKRPPRRGAAASCSATPTTGSLPRGRRIVRERPSTSVTDVAVGIHARRHRLRVPMVWPVSRRSDEGAGDDQRLRRAHGQLQPHRSSPPHAKKMGLKTCPRSMERSCGIAPHRRARQRHAGTRSSRVDRRLCPQSGSARVGHRPPAGLLRARRPEPVGIGTRFVVSELAPASRPSR